MTSSSAGRRGASSSAHVARATNDRPTAAATTAAIASPRRPRHPDGAADLAPPSCSFAIVVFTVASSFMTCMTYMTYAPIMTRQTPGRMPQHDGHEPSPWAAHRGPRCRQYASER